jgi:hypothetical protein
MARRRYKAVKVPRTSRKGVRPITEPMTRSSGRVVKGINSVGKAGNTILRMPGMPK